ncbi:MAG: DNA polymerase III subunit delta [Candidatus Cloacimonetes bacterium]|nr:DNA polymerase III subunit delta [Candidatus Cloacimonadota bacterium]
MAAQLAHYEFLRRFPKEKPVSVYLIFGPETYLIDKVLKAITKRFVTPDSEDFDYAQFYGDTAKSSDLLEQLDMMPFLAAKRVLLLRRLDEMDIADRNAIAEYCKNPMDTTILVLTATKTDKRQVAWKTIMNNATVVQCKQPYDARDIQRWVTNELRDRNIIMDRAAVELFSNSVENDYMVASNELEKVLIYAKGSARISLAAVHACVGKSRSNSIFELQNTLGMRDRKKALTMLESMIEADEPPILVVVMLTRFFTILWKIRTLLDSGMDTGEIAAKHIPEVYYKFRNDYIAFAQRYRRPSLRNTFSLLLQADIDLKSQETWLQRIILERLIYMICTS